jgi:transposase InsO family protein
MNDSQINSIEKIKKFLKSKTKVKFEAQDRNDVYEWVQKTLIKFRYISLKRNDKAVVKSYIKKLTGYSRAQVTRLIKKYKNTGYIKVEVGRRNKFDKKYSDKDIRLLAETDELHEYPNGAALKKILVRMAKIFKTQAYANIARISVAYIYVLRKDKIYQRLSKRYEKTKPNLAKIGERTKPRPNGEPGCIRVDTVHQGDQDKEKGVYHLNTIDEVTQFEFIGAVEKISEKYLVNLLIKLIESYPFKITQFHSDNGSEFINHQVVKLLNKLLIRLTKSRARKPNDNALVESKNGSIIRKWIGYGFIKQKHAGRINEFYFNYLNEYLNYHRPCGFATKRKDKRGKIKKTYKPENYQTPYEKFKNLPKAEQYLKEEITMEQLEKAAMRKTDNEMAQIVQEERRKLFNEIVY